VVSVNLRPKNGVNLRRGVVALLGLTLLLSWAAQASAASAPLVAIVSFRASASRLPAGGAPVRLTVQVRNARRCTFFGQRTATSSMYLLRTVPCSNGRVTVTMPAIANKTDAGAQLWYQVRVRGVGARTVRRTVIVYAAAAAQPSPSSPPSTPPPSGPTVVLAVSTTSIPAGGGQVGFTLASTDGSVCTLTSSPALWSGANPMSVGCNGIYNVNVSATTVARQWTVTFTVTTASGQSATSAQVLTQAAPGGGNGGGGFDTSTNWSGYVIPSASIFTEVGGSWTVPTLDCSVTPSGVVSVWAGIGGSGGEVLLQTGTASVCVNGVQQNDGWTEEYPSNPNHNEVFQNFPVSTGDSIHASVFHSSTGAWETHVDDLSTGLTGVLVTGEGWGVEPYGGTRFTIQGNATGLSYNGGTTAEWIVEYPALPGGQLTFADYGSLAFSNLTTSLAGWALTPSEGVEMAQGGAAVSTPSQPSGDGFTVSYTAPH
jgi:hypothetical protein